MVIWNSSGKPCRAVAVPVVLITTMFADSHQVSSAAPTHTQVVLLGTGNPPADPDRSGPATAVVVNGTPYLVDFGAGIVRRAKSAVVDKGIAALDPVNLRVVFVTHLHSDHTVGYPDLILTPWVLGRRVPLEVYGPSGIKAMTEHLLEAAKAKAALEKAGVAGVVVMRPVGKEQQISSTPTMYAGPYYAGFWGGYYGYGWGAPYGGSEIRTDTFVSIETLVYSLKQNKLVWASQSRTMNPSNVDGLVKDVANASARELRKQGLIGPS